MKAKRLPEKTETPQPNNPNPPNPEIPPLPEENSECPYLNEANLTTPSDKCDGFLKMTLDKEREGTKSRNEIGEKQSSN